LKRYNTGAHRALFLVSYPLLFQTGCIPWNLCGRQPHNYLLIPRFSKKTAYRQAGNILLAAIASNCISCYNDKVQQAKMFKFTERLIAWKKRYLMCWNIIK
jgi:hypothetical protein